MKKTMIAIMLILIFTTIANAGQQFKATGYQGTIEVKVTGYYPLSCSKKERKIEGGEHDKLGHPIRILEDDSAPLVSVATDPKIIKTGTVFTIKEFPNKKFCACDVGKAIKGKKIDIAVKNRKSAYSLPNKVIITVIKQWNINNLLCFLDKINIIY